jgi:transposase
MQRFGVASLNQNSDYSEHTGLETSFSLQARSMISSEALDLAGLRGEESISVLCRREGIAESLYYSWSKEFLEAGKRRLSGDTARIDPAISRLDPEKEAERPALGQCSFEEVLKGSVYVCHLIPPSDGVP